MKTIWGFDLGTASIGSAVVRTDDEGRPVGISHMGSRIVPQTEADSGDKGAFTQFVRGNAISKNADRTQKRTQRKGYDRYQMRRATLLTALRKHGLLPDASCVGLEKLALWSLRSRAATERIGLPELGRVLLHLNQKRGYKSARAEGNTKQDTDYVKEVNNRYDELRQRGQTVGEFLYEKLSETHKLKKQSRDEKEDFRVKDLVYPRAAYMEEFDRIMATQRQYYPEVLTDAFVRRLRDEIIYRQRPLKSCKGLVSVCEFEGRMQLVRSHERLCGPKVAPRSSPLAQACRIWEQVNNIRITDKRGQSYPITQEQKEKIARKLAVSAKLTWTELQKLLGLSKSDGYTPDKKIEKSGLAGNETYTKIAAAFGTEAIPEGLLDFSLTELPEGDGQKIAVLYDRKSGELQHEGPSMCIDPAVEQSPFYRLWHTIYSIADPEVCATVLHRKFGIAQPAAERLAAIDFRRQGFSNKSAKAMRRILPYLSRGYGYSDAMTLAGYDHSRSETAEQRQERPLKERLDLLPKNALRQPVVEKILNQLINLSNSLLERYGRPDEIRVELARELKQSREERERSAKSMRDNERENKRIIERIEKEHPGVRATRRVIQKYKLHQELMETIGGVCIYCGKPITLSEALTGDSVDIEHIIPQSLLFDDSMSNKTLSHRHCNREKGNSTARDYMENKGEAALAAYLEQVELLGKKNRTKRQKLLMRGNEIPDDFIDRQLRQSQYISRKAVELLREICPDVWTTSGSVTAYLRRVWGWEDVLRQLHPEPVGDWNKRDDHRHHALDALTVACTRQGYIQRLNTLSNEKTRQAMSDEIEKMGRTPSSDHRMQLAERYFASQRPFSTAEVTEQTAGILVSFKAGKRVSTPGVRKARLHGQQQVVQRVQVPRGALSEESVYGRIPDPATPDDKPVYVIRYPLTPKFDKTDKIVDARLREAVRAWLASSAKEGESCRWNGQPVRRVRCYTGLNDASVEAVRHDGATGRPTGFVKPGNNHHIAFYRSPDGKREYRICTFWHAVERKRFGLPVVIRRPDEVWNIVEKAPENRFPQTFLEKLPPAEWTYEFSLQQNEMVVLGMEPDVVRAAIEQHDYQLLGPHLYRMRSISTLGNNFDLWFLHQYETQPQKTAQAQEAKRSCRITSYKRMDELHPVKVRIDLLGDISLPDEL
ncbi:MAG: type II CRISPR RNA-guided endonuclease Cas9 [Rikenella sp.]|nr:type II CRISPR RNA-guided endonuclease Cas9 [Rikenella sp.]